jgi:hypothetical protein
MIPFVSQINQVHALSLCILKIHFNIVLVCTSCLPIILILQLSLHCMHFLCPPYVTPSKLVKQNCSRFEFRRLSVRILTRTSAILTEIPCDFPHSLQTNAGIYLDLATIASFQILSDSLATIYHTIICIVLDTDNVVKNSQNTNLCVLCALFISSAFN